MFNRLFQQSPPAAPSQDVLARAEQALMAETLLRATSQLLTQPDPHAAVEYMCASIVNATPHITAGVGMVWRR